MSTQQAASRVQPVEYGTKANLASSRLVGARDHGKAMATGLQNWLRMR